jgi:hypothetical protein
MGRPPLDAPPSTSWVDYWIDNTNYCAFFGCDDEGYCVGAGQSMRAISNGCGAVTSSCRIPHAQAETDYAAQHDAFLDSLLHEQQQLLAAAVFTDEDIISEPGLNNSANSCSECSALSLTLSPTSSNSSLTSDGSSRKRRRGLLTSTPRHDPTLMHPPVLSRGKMPELKTMGKIEPPPRFLHPAVRMQKDKAKGVEVGSNICAKGIDACLGKLREKMQLLTEHCQPGTAASMKRRSAVVSESHCNFIETRSLLTLRMGFLSMTYGILLRWDTGDTGLATLVVLRKNCHESFYKKRSAVSETSCCQPQVSPATSMDEDANIMLPPPYLVPRPVTFAPAEITVSVLYATGLHKKSHWTVQLQLADQTENILLAYDGNLMVPKLGSPLQYTVANSVSSAVLEIRLLEHRLRRKTRVLRSRMVLPLHSLEAVSSDVNEQPTSMRIPCPEGATIQIEAMLVSDAAVWQRRELEARRLQPRNRTRSPVRTVVEEEDVSSPWDWICMVC